MIKKLAIISALAMTSLPMTAFADITAINNSESNIVAATNGYCSGDYEYLGGVLQAHTTKTVSKYLFGIACGSACSVVVYEGKRCDPAMSVGVIDMDIEKGVTNVVNTNLDGLKLLGNGDTITVIQQSSVMKRLLKMFF